MELTKSNIKKTLENVNISGSSENIVSSGILKNIQVFGDQVDIDLILSNPTLQARKKLEVDIMKIIHADIYEKAKININVKIEKVDSKISSQSKKISGVDSIIAVSSAKGGVGKSTLTINLAATLAKKGCKVGILDADIYGPSVPTMMDVEGYVPKSIKVNGESKIEPIESYGVKIMSIGFFTKLDQAVVWRGPMASKALNQMIFDTNWGELDFLFLDLPPGTGDIHLSIVQSLPITGSIIISTPQNVALADARRGIKMFQQDNISVPILGLVENMAYFKTDDSNEKHYIFGEAGVKYLSKDLNINFLGEIPLFKSLREASDFGRPGSLQESNEISDIFDDISKNVVEQLLIRNKELPPTKVVEITNLVGCSAIKK
ncbi:P-loop NTPase [Flavobacteriaceae bacterium]|jgi:ATP-binding protein involved in chromosome partitioning|nr:P-loop NTPase [Flavobacteriaceae bacterium]MDA8547275.1 P-loop NTPase [Flavobacteriaceae bacterium]MDA9160606.1 P-loop NTPase [Flavobacteriaceae bacterium]MDA9883162.1 P-loop NTPase [Flavobacteriaceae bacterium]MDC1009876.1 P-loop NTPase [Flavobacteriaceae bacterium]